MSELVGMLVFTIVTIAILSAIAAPWMILAMEQRLNSKIADLQFKADLIEIDTKFLCDVDDDDPDPGEDNDAVEATNVVAFGKKGAA